MTSQSGKQTITTRILAIISSSKGNQTMLFSRLIEYISLKNHAENEAGRLFPEFFCSLKRLYMKYLLHEILGNMCIVFICFPVYDVKILKSTLVFLSACFSIQPKTSGQKFQCPKKTFSSILKDFTCQKLLLTWEWVFKIAFYTDSLVSSHISGEMFSYWENKAKAPNRDSPDEINTGGTSEFHLNAWKYTDLGQKTDKKILGNFPA